MTIHTPIPSGRIIARGGPVSAAIKAMRQANDLPPLLAQQFDDEAAEIDALRAMILAQLAADDAVLDDVLNRRDRCLVVLDALDGDTDLEADFTTMEDDGRGGCVIVGRSSDDDQDAGEQPEAEDEHGGDVQDEPHDPEEDGGAEEDERGLPYGADPTAPAAARNARRQLDALIRRGCQVPADGGTAFGITGPDGNLYVARRM